MAEGGSDVKSYVVSEEEARLLHALHLLGIKPSIGSTDDVERLLKVFTGVKSEPETHKVTEPSSSKDFHYPKLSTFFGEEGKGDTSWTSLRYELEALKSQKIFSDEQILLGLRRACRGHASDKLRRLGTEVKVEEVIKCFETEYGSVESRETIMKKFYSCHQAETETVTAYCSRLEEIFDQGVQIGALKRSDTQILKEVFHAGLKRDLKLMSMYQFDKISDYDDLKREIRRLDSSLLDIDKEEQKAKPCKAAVAPDGKSKEMTEIKDLLVKLNERIDKLENDKSMGVHQDPSFRGRGRGFRGRGRGQGFRGRGRGRNDYQPQRPISGQNFQPTCWTCNQKGHLQRDCPSYNNSIVCYNCNEPGHKQDACPKA